MTVYMKISYLQGWLRDELLITTVAKVIIMCITKQCVFWN